AIGIGDLDLDLLALAQQDSHACLILICFMSSSVATPAATTAHWAQPSQRPSLESLNGFGICSCVLRRTVASISRRCSRPRSVSGISGMPLLSARATVSSKAASWFITSPKSGSPPHLVPNVVVPRRQRLGSHRSVIGLGHVGGAIPLDAVDLA